MPHRTLKAWIAAALVVAGIVPWFFESDLPRSIVMERHILLGRYSVGWFVALAFVITPGCWLGAWAAWSLRARPHRAIAFRLIALVVSLVVGVILADVVTRVFRRPLYVRTAGEALSAFPQDQRKRGFLHRPPGQRYVIRYRDEPEAARSYPGRPPGHPPVDITLTTDARGFRNSAPAKRCDVVAVGDSFTEGCLVSDEHAWPVLLGQATGQTVYNLGMSGAAPEDYRGALEAVGLPLRPRAVVLMLYEFNDFGGVTRSGGGGMSLRQWLDLRARTSPVVRGLESVLIAWLGPIHADGPVPGFDAIGRWMPTRLPAGAGARPYALKPKRVIALATGREAFAASYGWTSTAELLRDVHVRCEQAGARLWITLAPTKARIVMSLLGGDVDAEALHAFASLRRSARGRLPEPAIFQARVRANLDAREAVVGAFCREEGIGFVSLAATLSTATAAGRQAYYTYDQHWTPEGNRLVAGAIADALSR